MLVLVFRNGKRSIKLASHSVTSAKALGGLPPGLAGYLDLCLLCANSADPAGLGFGVGHAATAQLGKRLRTEISAYIRSPGGFRRRRRAAADVLIDEVRVHTTLSLRPDGRIEHLHSYRTTSDDAVVGLCIAILRDPRLARDEVRRCALDSCGRLFRRLGTKRVYCSPACTESGDHLLAVERNRRKRQRDAQTARSASRASK